MHKKLTKYIDRYDEIENVTSYELMPNGGMIVLMNYGKKCEVMIGNVSYTLESLQGILLNAYTESVTVHTSDVLHLLAIRFKGAGASFFYEEQMNALMEFPLEPIFIEKNILEDELESYLLKRLTPSKLPFNIMKIIHLLEEQGSDYSIEDIMAIANVPRKVLDKMFNLRTGLTFKAYATLTELQN